jgi:hypothetical protein
MTNLNSNGELFEGKKVYDYSVHHRMPRIKFGNKRKRRRIAYKGIVNNDNNGSKATTSGGN